MNCGTKSVVCQSPGWSTRWDGWSHVVPSSAACSGLVVPRSALIAKEKNRCPETSTATQHSSSLTRCPWCALWCHEVPSRRNDGLIVRPVCLMNQRRSAALVPCGALVVPRCAARAAPSRPRGASQGTPTGGKCPLGLSDTRSHFCAKHRDPWRAHVGSLLV